MARRRRLDPFSTMMVKTYDLEYMDGVITDQITQRMQELVSNGVVQDYLNELEVYADGTDLKIKTGAAYINGERAYNGALATLAIVEGAGVLIRIKYATAADPDAHATRLDDIGGPHTVWFTDDIEIYTVDDESAADPDAINLAWAGRTGGVVTVTDYREFAHLLPPLAEASVETAHLVDANVTAAKLAANSTLSPLHHEIAEAVDAGESLDPTNEASFVSYGAAQGGGYEYKVVGTCQRIASNGPIRRLRLTAQTSKLGTGTAKVYLVAWGEALVDDDPDSGTFDGIMAEQAASSGTGDIDIELDVTSLPTTWKWFGFGIVLRNSTNGAFSLFRVALAGLR